MPAFSLNRFSPLKLRGGHELKNRVVIPAMASESGDEGGRATENTFHHYTRLSEAQAGLIMVEYTYVHPSGKSESQQLGASDDSQIDGLAKLAGAIKKSSALSFLQLTHSGAKSSRGMTGGKLFAPSPIPVPVKDRRMEVPDEMSRQDIDLWKRAFFEAAERASLAGFQGIELHSAHGYGLNQWISPLTNQRNDDYGGALQNRSRLLLEIVSSIRHKIPSLLVSVRIPGQDFFPGGLTPEHMKRLAVSLEQTGVDLINVSSGIGGWRRPLDRKGEGYLVQEASDIQTVVKIPVIGVGGIQSGAYIDQIVSEQSVSLAAVGRAILSDPKKWGETNLRRDASFCDDFRRELRSA